MASAGGSLSQRAAVRFRLARRRFGRWAANPDQFPVLEIVFAAVAVVLGLAYGAAMVLDGALGNGIKLLRKVRGTEEDWR